MYFKIKGTYFKIYGLYFLLSQGFDKQQLTQTRRNAVISLFFSMLRQNPLIALSDSLFCAKWIHTAVYAHIFRKYFFLLPERPKHLPPQPTQAYRKEICRFFQQSPKNSTAECLGSIALCLLHGQKTPPAIRKTATWPAPTYTLTTKSFANASTCI